MTQATIDAARRRRLQVGESRPDLRPAEADARDLRADARQGAGAAARSALRSITTRTCRTASSRSGASRPSSCRRRRRSSTSCWTRSGASVTPAITTSAWITSPRPATTWRAPSGRARLHRNFQGYSTRPDCDLVGLGVSAISKIGPTYSQNVRTVEEYYDRLEPRHAADGARHRARPRRHPAAGGDHGADVPLRGREGVDRDRAHDQVRRLLQDRTRANSRCSRTKVWSRTRPSGSRVTPKGKLLVRAVAMTFDRYLRADQRARRYSKIV